MMSERDDRELYEQNPLGRFSDRAVDYRRHRPDYPSPAVDAVLAGLGDPLHLVVADIGAGTGISSRQLAERGAKVIAIEPNPEMRAAADPHPRVEWREGSAEATGLAASSVGLVTCAQSFHWFRPEPALREFHRILASGGRLALFWNVRDLDDPLTLEYTTTLREVSHDHPAETRVPELQGVVTSRWFGSQRIECFAHQQALDLEGLIGRAVSSSYVPRDDDSLRFVRERLTASWKRHHDEHGLVRLRYRTDVFLRDRVPGE